MILFNRNNEEVISSALNKTKEEFVNEYKHLTKQNILQKVYFEIRKKSTSKQVTNVTSKHKTDSSFIDSIADDKTDVKPKSIVPNTNFDSNTSSALKIEQSILDNVIGGTLTVEERKFSKDEKCNFVTELIKKGKTNKEIYNSLPFDGFGFAKINKLREDIK